MKIPNKWLFPLPKPLIVIYNSWSICELTNPMKLTNYNEESLFIIALVTVS